MCSKTLTVLVGAEPLVQAQAAEVQRLQFFLSEASWNVDAITAQRLTLLMQVEDSAPSASGVLVIDDTGDRKDGQATDHVSRQYLGSAGETDNGIVAVTSLWADERYYYPLHVEPYTPAARPFCVCAASPPDMKKPDKQGQKYSLGFRGAVLNL
jgi:SRSO17 transposase